jgi:hypothetical protein
MAVAVSASHHRQQHRQLDNHRRTIIIGSRSIAATNGREK